jgi:hypothetical protein
MNVKSASEADAKRTRRSVMAYLEGEQNLQWVAGTILSTDDMDSTRLFVRELAGYGNATRYEELVRWVLAII